jgi:tetratricopeptide (TPR) repeat protein
MKNLIPLLLFLCFILNLQSQNPEIEKLNQQIENSVRLNPDSTKIYMFRLLEHSEALHDTTIGKTLSNIGIMYNRLAVPDSAEFYMKKALDYTQDYPQVNAKMYLNLAINYRMGSRYPESLSALTDAIKYYKMAGDKVGEGIALGEIGSNYNYMLDSEKALKYLKQSITMLSEAENISELTVVKQKLANLYYNNGNYAFARDLYEEVLPVFAKNKGANYYYTLLSYADSFIQLEENYKEAEEALLETVSGLKTMNYFEIMWVSVSKLAQVYNATGRTELAQQHFKAAYEGAFKLNSPRFMEISAQYLEFLNDEKQYNEALKVIARVNATNKNTLLKMNAENEIAFLKQAVSSYGQKGMVENSLKAFERMDFLKDSLNDARNETTSLALQEAYQNDLQREKNNVLKNNNELLMENNSKKDKILILSILISLLILAIGMVLFIANRNKLRFQKELVTNLENSEKVLKQKNKLESELSKQRERTLINKEKELVEVSLEMSDLQNRLLEVIDQRENPEMSKNLADKLKELLSQNNYWKYFKVKFVEVHPRFAAQLIEMFPNFSENDIAFCCMLKLQLSTQEIASLMFISTNEVESKKTSLRRKMGLEDNILAFEKLIDHLE